MVHERSQSRKVRSGKTTTQYQSNFLTIFRLSNSSFDPARKAYEDAKTFSSKLTQEQYKQIWLDDKVSMQTCYEAVLTAKEVYEGRQRAKKARKWLASFSLRVKYYGGILDVLSQHHPEYVALAWGTVKFLFVVRMLQLERMSEN